MKVKRNDDLQKKMYRYPYLIGLVVVVGVSIVVQILAILDCFWPVIEYEIDAVSSVMSTCSGVLAGLYGITLTGYIFFADRFQETSQEDESLYDAVQALLMRYNHMAGFISLMCMICIVLTEGIVLYGRNTLLPLQLYRFWVNETLLLCFCTMNLILYFVISVLDPHKIRRISTQKRSELGGEGAPGDPEEFLAVWGQIEDNLAAAQEELSRQLRFRPSLGRNRPRLVQTMEILRNYGRINYQLWKKLEKLRKYHNLSMHDMNLAVSQDMCDLAREALAELEMKAGK